MELEDPKLNTFLDTVCQYMETWYSYDDVKYTFNFDELCEEPHSEFKKFLQVLYHALDPLHKDWFDNFFTPDTIEWDYVHKLISTHCFTLVKHYKSKGIFLCLMYICSFTHSLLDYCDRKGLTGRLRQTKYLIKEQFLKHIKDRFFYKGGWDGFKIFCQRENLPKILKLINDCYCEVSIFHTYLINNEHQVYTLGCHGKETIDAFFNNIRSFERSIFEAFKYDMYVNPDYEEDVKRSFITLRANLAKGPSYDYLPDDVSVVSLSSISSSFML